MKGGEEDDDTLDGGPGGDTLDGEDEVDMDTVTYAGCYGRRHRGPELGLRTRWRHHHLATAAAGATPAATAFIDIEMFVGSEHDDIFIAGPEADNARRRRRYGYHLLRTFPESRAD